jgi:hypothetical protein
MPTGTIEKRKRSYKINPFQSNFSATRILPSSYLFWAGKSWWITRVLKEKNININRKSTTCAICWVKSVLHQEKRREQENHYGFPVPEAFSHVVRILANR